METLKRHLQSSLWVLLLLCVVVLASSAWWLTELDHKRGKLHVLISHSFLGRHFNHGNNGTDVAKVVLN